MLFRSTPEEKAIDQRYAPAAALQANADDLARARADGRSLDDVELDGLARALVASPIRSSVAANGQSAKGDT